MPVTEFQGEYRFLSNFWISPFVYEGIRFRTVQHAFQAAKCDKDEDIARIQMTMSPGTVKRIARTIQMREGWNELRLEFMEEFVRAKFQQHPDLMAQLKKISGPIQEGNLWGDVFWGVDLKTGKGENNLGKIIMKIRSE